MAAPSLSVRRAAEADLDLAAPLFDRYRQFYGQPADPDLARRFLAERLARDESVVLLALDAATGDGLGFTQLYPAFTSVGAQRLWILNDLFVADEARRRGVARALLEAARAFGAATGARRLVLQTALDNAPAQALYASLGWRRDADFVTYELEL